MTITALSLALFLAATPGGDGAAAGAIEQARRLMEAGHAAEAEAILREAVSRHPEHPDLRLEIGRLRLRQGDLQAASLSLEEALARAADPASVLPMLGQTYLLLDRRDEARAVLEQAVRHNPSDLGSLYNLGRLLRLEGESEESVRTFEKGLGLSPDARMRHRIQVNLGALYLETRRHSRALPLYQELARREPAVAEWRYNLALTQEGLGQPRAALEEARQAIRLEAEMAAAHTLAASQLRTLGELEAALEAVAKALVLAPDDPHALALAATLDLDRGRHEAAVGRARRLIEIEPTHPRGHYLLGQALLATGDREGAEAEFATHRRLAAERRAFHHTAASLGEE